MSLKIVKDINQESIKEILKIWNECNKRFDKLPLPIIGVGGFSHVYEYISNDKLKFAIKAIRKDPEGNYLTQKDERNLEILNGHPFIPTLFAYIEKEIMIMERVEGITAEQYNCSSNRIKLNKYFVENFKKTLDYMRSNGIEIGDIEERNVVINHDGFGVIVDTGMCYMPSKGEKPIQSFSAEESYQIYLNWSNQFFNKFYCDLSQTVGAELL